MSQNRTANKKTDEVFYMNQFYDTNIQSTLSSAEAQVYGAYLRYSNGGKDKAWPGQKKLSTNLGLSVKTISRALKTLIGKGYIILQKRGNDNIGNSLYIVRTPLELGFKVIKDDGEDEISVAAAKALAPKAIIKPKKTKTVSTDKAISKTNVNPEVATPDDDSFFDGYTPSNTAIKETNVNPEPTIAAHKLDHNKFLYSTLTEIQIDTIAGLANTIYTQCIVSQDKYILRYTREQFIETCLKDANKDYDHKLEGLTSFASAA